MKNITETHSMLHFFKKGERLSIVQPNWLQWTCLFTIFYVKLWPIDFHKILIKLNFSIRTKPLADRSIFTLKLWQVIWPSFKKSLVAIHYFYEYLCRRNTDWKILQKSQIKNRGRKKEDLHLNFCNIECGLRDFPPHSKEVLIWFWISHIMQNPFLVPVNNNSKK